MLLFFLVFALFVINALSQDWAQPFNCSYHNLTVSCVFNEGFDFSNKSLNVGYDQFQNLHQFFEIVQSFLAPPYANWAFFFDIYTLIDRKFLESGANLKPIHADDVILVLQEKIRQYYKLHKVGGYDEGLLSIGDGLYPLKKEILSPDKRLAIIISKEYREAIVDQQTWQETLEMKLPALSNLLRALHPFMLEIGVFFGTSAEMNIPCYQLKRFFVHKHSIFYRDKPLIRVICHQIVDLENKGIIYRDIREEVLLRAFEERSYDYFMLLDIEDLFVVNHNPLMKLFVSLVLNYSPVTDRLKSVVSHCPSNPSHRYYHPELCIEEYPLDLTITRDVVNFIKYARDRQKASLFIEDTHPGINNYLLLDILRIIDGVACISFAAKSLPADDESCASVVTAQFALNHELYISKLESGRRLLIEFINNRYLPGNLSQLLLNPADLKYQSGDVGFEENIELFTDIDGETHEADNDNWNDQISVNSANLHLQRIINDTLHSPTIHSYQGLQEYLRNISENPHLFHVVYSNKYPYLEYPRRPRAKVAIITAIFGGYEKTCKFIRRQTIPTDFYCFADSLETSNQNGWILDTTPYHLLQLEEELHNDTLRDLLNSLHHNQHPFNIAKFYKTSFQKIPILQGYEQVVWLDGSLTIHSNTMVEEMLAIMDEDRLDCDTSHSNERFKNGCGPRSLVVFEHFRNGRLDEEVRASIELTDRYDTTILRGLPQPRQDIFGQYAYYLRVGYNSSVEYWRGVSDRQNYGVWCTCLVGFDLRKAESLRFLSRWNYELRARSTQDQVSFPFVVQMERIFPHSLSDDRVFGAINVNTWFTKVYHGF